MNLPEDHMDELFRKAGEMYPLKTDGADWDKVMTRLQEVSDDSATTLAGGRASNRKWWLLTLLIVPFALICNKYIAHQGSANTPTGQTAAVSPASNASAQTAAVKTVAGTPATGASATGTPAATPQVASAMPKATVAAPQGAPSTAGVNATPGVASAATVRAGLLSPTRASRQVATSSTLATRHGASLRQDANPGEGSGSTAVNSDPTNNQPDSKSAAATPQETNTFDLAQSLASGDLVMLDKPRDVALSSRALDAAPVKDAPLRKAPVGHFYAGVLGGPDVSTVKFQEVSKPGYSLGIILGYRFNRSLAVEASALWDRKNYYTSGEYFNKAKAGIPASYSLGNMNGVCEMFEIPVSLRWDFYSMKHGGFYATGGISSYMMKKETYSYEATAGLNSWPVTGPPYYNSGNNFFSMLHLSVGYTLQWRGVGDLRIEPYFKIPLSGVGIGSLPITSSGLYVGLTHSFR